MKAYLQALVTEGALEADGSGYRISVRAIGPTSQRELFQTSESGGRPRGQSPQGDNHQPAEDTPRFTPEELALIEASAQEENDGRPDIVGDRTEAEVASLAARVRKQMLRATDPSIPWRTKVMEAEARTILRLGRTSRRLLRRCRSPGRKRSGLRLAFRLEASGR